MTAYCGILIIQLDCQTAVQGTGSACMVFDRLHVCASVAYIAHAYLRYI